MYIVVSVQTQELRAVELWSSRMQQLQTENGLLQVEIKQARDEVLLAEAQVSVYYIHTHSLQRFTLLYNL